MTWQRCTGGPSPPLSCGWLYQMRGDETNRPTPCARSRCASRKISHMQSKRATSKDPPCSSPLCCPSPSSSTEQRRTRLCFARIGTAPHKHAAATSATWSKARTRAPLSFALSKAPPAPSNARHCSLVQRCTPDRLSPSHTTPTTTMTPLSASPLSTYSPQRRASQRTSTTRGRCLNGRQMPM